MAKYKIIRRVEHYWYVEADSVEDISHNLETLLEQHEPESTALMDEYFYELGSDVIYDNVCSSFFSIVGLDQEIRDENCDGYFINMTTNVKEEV